MNSQNAQIVRELYDAFGRGDIGAMRDRLTEDVEWDLPGAAPYSGIRHGRQRVLDFFSELDKAVRIDEFDLDELLADGDKVVALGRERATVKATGRHYEQNWAHVFTLRNGKVSEVRLFEDTHAAASAFGESTREREALTGPLHATHPPFSGRSDT